MIENMPSYKRLFINMRQLIKSSLFIKLLLFINALLIMITALTASCVDEAVKQGQRQSALLDSKIAAPLCINKIYIKPNAYFPHETRLVIFTLQSAKDAKEIAQHLTNQLKEELLSKETFRIIQTSNEIFNSIEDRMAYARDNKYELILVGEINNIVQGDEYRQALVSIKTKIIDPFRQTTLLSMENCKISDPSTRFSLYEFKTKGVTAIPVEKIGALVINEISAIISDLTYSKAVE
ncbi:membrane or secreted protein [Candidatus Magnetoovum chiemensis]|nr:membrane or secreted protein [Candidatus Magnetoovum chiemensis]